MISRHLKRIHLIGIGGAGMSPLAELLYHQGYIVTGSDKTKSDVTIRLESLGIKIQYHHNPDLIKDAQLVVYSSAIKEDNPERVYVKNYKKREIRRAELLGDLMRLQPAICISGTHGKTTTTSLIGLILLNAGLKPTLLTGGILPEQKSGFIIGEGRLMVVEADEFDRSFLAMYPTIALITNIDSDHLDCYKDIDEIKDAFISFVNRVPFFGEVVVCIEDKKVREILPYLHPPFTTYGFS
ncbi:MAG: Mur ligase domain-containing protein, partial [Chitinispirillaceae bacterium]|nr:Mur ligase domain-containing protein [Chitinispirillaceae bacterium]